MYWESWQTARALRSCTASTRTIIRRRIKGPLLLHPYLGCDRAVYIDIAATHSHIQRITVRGYLQFRTGANAAAVEQLQQRTIPLEDTGYRELLAGCGFREQL